VPPCTPAQAAAIAEAALADTLEAVAACGADRRVVALDGEPGPWLPPGFEVVAQVDGGFDQRLAAAWAVAGGPGVQIGMDTPQVTAGLLDHALAPLDTDDAALGLAVDGGWWAIGLRRPDARSFLGVPMSTEGTGAAQRNRLEQLGLSVADLPALVDLDTASDLAAVTASGAAIRTTAQARRIGVLQIAAPA
jgi:glycosyltransferase A (GT-A) superfamily protein (DUF2064 family)